MRFLSAYEGSVFVPSCFQVAGVRWHKHALLPSPTLEDPAARLPDPGAGGGAASPKCWFWPHVLTCLAPRLLLTLT